MKTLNELLNIYQQQHTKRCNIVTHLIGIPAIIFSLLMLFNWVSIDIATKVQISFSWILVVCMLIYYFALHIRLALCATVILCVMTIIATWIARPSPTTFSAILFLVLFLGGWILQFVGHFCEKQKPAFFSSLTQLLIGPLFVLVEGLKALKIEKYFLHQ